MPEIDKKLVVNVVIAMAVFGAVVYAVAKFGGKTGQDVAAVVKG